MSTYDGMNDTRKKNTKPIAAIPMAGAIVTAAILLSGLSLIGSHHQPVLAQQQNMTGTGNATNATMTGAMGDMRSNTTTAGGPTAAQGEGSGGGAAGGGETTASGQ